MLDISEYSGVDVARNESSAWVWIVSVLLAVAIGICVFLAARERAAHSKSAIRQKYRDYPSVILGVTEPITFDEVVSYEDGGTKSIKLTDSTGKKFQACL